MLLALWAPVSVSAHAELETATPTDGATVPGPFEGPIVLTFSAVLAAGSKADLLDQGGGEIASAVVDGPGAKMTITLETPLGPDVYEVKWVTVAEDGDLLRGTLSLTVSPPAATPEPTPSPTPMPSPSASAAPATPSPQPTPSASALPSPTPPESVGSSDSGDVLIPIVVVLLVVGVGAAYLLSRRGRPAS
jgi:methionine-rich copper-binding protein CopC